MAQLAFCFSSNYLVLTLLLGILVFININQISAYSTLNESDDGQSSPMALDLAYENLANNKSPILINPNSRYISDDNNDNDDDDDDDDDLQISRNPWSELFHRHYAQKVLTPSDDSLILPGYVVRRSPRNYIPYPSEKRTIPIELQKAFFAHGIVGR